MLSPNMTMTWLKERIVPDPSTGCWLWTRSKDRSGYGKSGCGRTSLRAHRVAYTLAHGTIPPGMLVCHRCDVRACVNPDHLFLGTAKDNTRDMFAKGRQKKQPPPQFATVDDPNVATLAIRLTALRRKNSLSQAEVASATGLPFRVTVTEIEQGRRSVSALELARLAALYRTTPNRLLKGLEVAP